MHNLTYERVSVAPNKTHNHDTWYLTAVCLQTQITHPDLGQKSSDDQRQMIIFLTYLALSVMVQDINMLLT